MKNKKADNEEIRMREKDLQEKRIWKKLTILTNAVLMRCFIYAAYSDIRGTSN